MTNREVFFQIFRRYASEIWALPEEEFLEWANEEANNSDTFVYCQDCIHADGYCYCDLYKMWKNETDFCNRGKRRDDS